MTMCYCAWCDETSDDHQTILSLGVGNRDRTFRQCCYWEKITILFLLWNRGIHKSGKLMSFILLTTTKEVGRLMALSIFVSDIIASCRLKFLPLVYFITDYGQIIYKMVKQDSDLQAIVRNARRLSLQIYKDDAHKFHCETTTCLRFANIS